MDLIFVRHGQTDLNFKKVYQGKIDTNLNVNGINQAKEVRKKLENMKIKRAYTSPLKRAKETLNIILEDKDIEVYEDKRIEEIDFGKWDTIAYDKVMIGYENEYEEFMRSYKDFTFPEGESFENFYNRCAEFLDDIIDCKSNDTILVVAHGGVIRVCICYLLSLSKDMFYNFSVKQGCFSQVSIYEGINIIDELNK